MNPDPQNQHETQETPLPQTPSANPEQDTPVATAAKARPVTPLTRYGAIAGCVLAVAGWCMLMLNEWPALIAGIAAIVLCALGCRRPRSNMRNLAITGIVVAGVLVLDILIIKCLIAYISTL